MNKIFKSRFMWLNRIICKIFGCAIAHVEAMSFEEGHQEPVEILMICPRCSQAHCHDWPKDGVTRVDLDGVGVDFCPDFSVDRKTLH